MGSGLEKAAGFAKTLIGIFTSLPPEAQATIIALAGLNKLSGGAVTSVIGSIGKGIAGALGDALFSRGATPVNPLFVSDVAGGLGGKGALPGAVGGAVTAVAAPAAAVIAVAAAGLIIQDQVNKQGDALVTQAQEYAKKATDAELANSIKGVKEQLDTIPFNSFDVKNKVVATLNTLIAEQNRRTTGANTVTGGRGDASTAARVNELGKMAGIYERAVAKGLHPTYTQLQRTAARNDAHARAQRAKLDALKNATTIGSGQSAAASAAAGARAAAASDRAAAAIRAKKMSVAVTVPVSVSSYISVRSIGQNVKVASHYNSTAGLHKSNVPT